MAMTVSTLSVADDPRWARILARDRTADGTLWYSVLTTGVYCRPSCPSRRANPVNVSLHDSIEAARATGFRPCLRCDPEGASRSEVDAALVAAACRTIEQAEEMPTAAALAAAAGCSAGHLHRRFRQVTGLTPRGYAAAHRAARLRCELTETETVTAAFHAAGYGSAGHFYAAAQEELGMSPARYRAGGAGEVLRHAIGRSSLGLVLVASSASGIAAILLGDDAGALLAELRGRFPKGDLHLGDDDYAALVDRVVAFVEAPAIGLDLPLDIRGTAFQRRVWQALQAIPAGASASYTDIATGLGAARAVRAVAGACAANAHAVAIPCHRAVRADGTLAGYRWGIDRKRALIAREAAR